MRKFLLGVILSLFLFCGVTAYDFDFELTETLDTGDLYRGIMKGYYDGVTGNWYVYIPKKDGSEADLIIKEFDTSWTETDTDTETCGGTGGDQCYDTDCSAVIGNERYFSCLGRENDATPFLKLYHYYFDNDTFTEMSSRTNFATYPNTIATSNLYVDEEGGFSLVGWDTFVRNNNFFFTVNGDLTDTSGFDIPSSYEGYDDLQIVYCDEAYHVFVLKDGIVTDLIFDVDDYTYLGTGTGISFSDNITENNFGVSSDGEVIYTATSGTNNGVNTLNLASYDCEYDDLIQIYSENLEYDDVKVDSFEDDDYDLELEFLFEDSSGNIEDGSDNNNDGVYTGSLYQQDGYRSYGLGFDGVDDYINVSDSASLDISDNTMTMETLVKFDRITGSVDYGLIDKKPNGSGYKLVMDNQNTQFSRVVCYMNTQSFNSGNLPFYADQWYYIACVYNGTHINGYLNGTKLGSTAYSSNVVANNKKLVIGADSDVGAYGDFLNGTMDDVRVYDAALTDSQIQDRWNFYQSTISKPFLTKGESEIYYLFFEEEISGTDNMKVVYENPCWCGDWVNTSICQEDLEKQTRNCNPDLCESEEESRYIYTEYCGKVYNRSQGIYELEYETVTVCYECESEYKYFDDGETTSKCEPQHHTIPSGAINIFTNSTVISVLDGEGCDNGNYDIKVCNPTYDCNEETFSCEYPVNLTTKNNENYGVGDIVTSKMDIRVDSSCRCPRFLLSDKIKRFKVLGVTCVSYDIPCEEEFYCLDNNYRGLRHIDCSVSDIEPCQYGCSNGNCISDSAQREGSPANILTWLDLIMYPNDTWKFIWSMVISAIVGIVGVSIGKGKQSGLFFLVGFGIAFSVFVLIGWIPAVIILVLIFFVLVYILLKGIK